MKVLLIQDPTFTDMSLGPPSTSYTQQSQYNSQEEPSVAYWNHYPLEQHYAPAEIYEEGFYEEQLWLDQESVYNKDALSEQFYETNNRDQLMCNNIPVRKIQNVAFFVNGKVAQLALDSGCEGDCIREN